MRIIFEDRMPRHRLQLVKLDASGKRLALLDGRGAVVPSMFVYERTHAGWWRVATLEFAESPVCLAFSPDGSRVLISTEQRLLIFDVGAQAVEEWPIPEGGGANEIDWLDEERVVAAYPERWPPSWVSSLRENKHLLPIVPPLQEVPKHIPRIATSHDRSTLAFGHTFEFVFVFDVRNGQAAQWDGTPQLTRSLGNKDKPWEWAHFARRIWFSADDRQIAVASQPRGRNEWDEMGIRIGMRDGSNQRLLRIKSHMGSVDVSPDFEIIAAAVSGKPGEVALWDTATTIVRDTINVGRATRDIRFSSDGRLLVVACEERFGIFER